MAQPTLIPNSDRARFESLSLAKGNAGKDAVIAAVTVRGFAPKDDNEADAIALLLWAIETRGGVQ